MSPSSPVSRNDSGALDCAIESDRLYFELAAQTEPLAGGRLAWLPGRTAMPSAAVVHRIDPQALARLGRPAIELAEARLRGIGAGVARLYLDRAGTIADDLLRACGYACETEIAFAGTCNLPDMSGLRIRPIESASDWAAKLRFHEDNPERPDGYAASALDWVEMERLRCSTGCMTPWLCELDGAVVGAFCLFACGPLVRIKNVVTAASHRRQGFGRTMICQIARHARERGFDGACVFAVSGGAGERLYRSAGLRPVGAQMEWSRTL